MDLGGRAWRGYFPVGGELTSGIPDDKEGLYFGAELDERDPRVIAGTPLHGRNLFPQRPDLRGPVLAWLNEMTRLAHALMRGIALSLGLDANYFFDRYTRDPLILFRIFNYPGVSCSHPIVRSLGRRRTYRLRRVDHSEAGRCRWTAGEEPHRLGGRAAGSQTHSSATSATCWIG